MGRRKKNIINSFIYEELDLTVRTLIKDQTIYLCSDDVARGLGFVDKEREKISTATSGGTKHQPEAVRWSRINDYVDSFRDLIKDNPDVEIPDKITRGSFIPEQIFYLLAMKANSEAAKKFQIWIAFEILPELRKNGMFSDVTHDRVRDITKHFNTVIRSTIYKLVWYGKNQGHKLVPEEEIADIVPMLQRDGVGIPIGKRDNASTEQLFNLLMSDFDLLKTITDGMRNEKDYYDIIQDIIDLTSWYKINIRGIEY